MSKGINVNREFGVNPTIPVCFYCGEDKNEIALLGCNGYKEKDPYTGKYIPKEAPRRMVLNIEPCDKCLEKYKDYVLVVEAETVNGGPNPTGRYFAVKTEAVTIENPGKIVFMSVSDFTATIESFK